ncbi:MAG: methyltransferase domain-containing protein [Candidatus Eisenbacteria bacterium]|uniref:Methyltransferase domain-containing protein n=1 Tax=Eiseniibacteriota bacterium TaxID=2212470 RepID=A0A937XB70_UNCEI|nr:methyltransferase domain-containing protein [Candidatus Eisenbacteria bacterium]
MRRWAPRLPDGPVLDLGCGAGRDAVYLALRGHPVVGIDRLPDALARAAALARRHGVQLRLLAADLRGSPPHLPADIAPAPGEVPAPAEARASRKARPPLRFAAVLMIRFFAAHLGAWIAERLLPDGLLLLEGPAPEEVERGRLRRVSRTLSPAAAPAAFPGWTVLESTTERDEEQLVLTRLVLRREPAPGLDAGGDGGDPRPKTGGGTPRPEGRRR